MLMKKLALSLFLFLTVGSAFSQSGIDMRARMCGAVLNEKFYESNNINMAIDIARFQQNYICESTDESTRQERFNNSSLDLSVFDVLTADGQGNEGSNSSSEKLHRYCNLSDSDLVSSYSLDVGNRHFNSALNAWESCVLSANDNDIYVSFEQSTNGQTVTGRIYNTVGNFGNFATIKGLIPTSENLPEGKVNCTVGVDDSFPYAITAVQTSFRCNIDFDIPKDGFLGLQLVTNLGDPSILKIHNSEDLELMEQIAKLKKDLQERNNNFLLLNNTIAEQAQEIRALKSDISSLHAMHPNEAKVEIVNNGLVGGFLWKATPNGLQVTVQIDALVKNEPRGGDSCIITIDPGSVYSACDELISFTAQHGNNTWATSGIVSLHVPSGTIVFQGNSKITELGEINYPQTPILYVR